MEIPVTDIRGCADAHERLQTAIIGLSDADIKRASNLPGWSIGHVLTHLARNAEAMCRRIEGAVRGEVVDQYVGGASGRAREIAAGATRAAREIHRDVMEWSNSLDGLFGSLPAAVWTRPVRTVKGTDHPVSLLPFRRWREVEVHLTDLGVGPTPSDWSQELVDRALPRLVAGLPSRVDQRALMAWLLGRGPAPDPGPWE